ncbi:hypothetical protein E2C01_050465 [Portunus trituberculatus]|uniref:Uncharacterized protein n=1 Tax=Portunus trituberculatus TaxID=210409 RepID=A0A5B7GJ19_PORTR|nr:hypothetical protein [Portunus trituberculatus]
MCLAIVDISVPAHEIPENKADTLAKDVSTIIGSDLQETNQVAIIKMTEDKGDDANLTRTSFPEMITQARRGALTLSESNRFNSRRII